MDDCRKNNQVGNDKRQKEFTRQINIKDKTNEESIRKALNNNNIHGNRGQLVNG